jgi:DNA-binding winged helix-turn-helix (wHTH) protein/Tol biopolymer transport system component
MISESSQFIKNIRIYEFDEFRLDAENLLLLRSGETVQLPIKAVQILLTLVEANGRVMKKEEILKRVWADTFIEESNLSHHVAVLRRALGEEKNSKKFIETIPRRGYRFIAPVTEIESGTDEVIKSERTRTQIIEEEEIEIREPIESISAETAAPETSAPPDAVAAKKTRRGWRSPVLVGAFVIAVAAIVFAIYKLSDAAPIRFEAKNTMRLTSSGRVKLAAISPDGKFVVYSQEEMDGRQSLRVKHIGSDSDLQIAAPSEIEYYALNTSPDGNQLYYINEKGALFQMPVLGGVAKKIADGLYVRNIITNIGISPDGKQIAFVRRFEKDATALFIINADGANERKLAAFEQPIRLIPYVVWSPDGKVVACNSVNSGNAINVLAIQVADGTSAPIVRQDFPVFILQIGWMPDSKSLLAVGGKGEDAYHIWRILQLSIPDGGAALQITDNTTSYSGISLTSDGRFAATVKQEQIAHIWTMPTTDLMGARQLTTGFEKMDGKDGLDWMADGRIVYDSSPSGKKSVWMVKVDDSNPVQIIRDGFRSATSPDGRNLIYINDEGLRLINTGDGSEKQLTWNSDNWQTFSPDGEWIVFTRFGERVGLWKMPVAGGEAKPILFENAICPAVSPDGKTIAFVWRRAGQPNRIALVSSDGGEIIRSFDVTLQNNPAGDNQKLQWTPDGSSIYFVSLKNGISNIWKQPVDGFLPVQVTDFKDGRIFNFAFSPDGKQLALSRGTFNSDVVLIENSK